MSTYNTVFKNAVADYKYLKNKKYSDKAALKLVGDHYRLSKTERNCLLRGIVALHTARMRKIKLVTPQKVKGRSLGIDWYNVLITIESYLKGHLLFMADDGVVRDTSSTHGSYRQSQVTPRAIDSVCKALLRLKPAKIRIVMDSPISYSKKMADELRAVFGAVLTMPFEISLMHSADYELKSFDGIVASSDSVIIDCAAAVFDIARFCLTTWYGYRPVLVENLVFTD
jgi:hypothetical protein